ncbi:MAG: MATE family efflux transporter [Lachnospiraceae bacterium]|nr:MATE family efflux transporter [Lachnospiraceae bacterium]
MMVQALYNVVDSIYVAQLSENALTGVTLAFPMQNLMIAVGSGTAVGINAMLSQSLGEKQFEHANKSANTGLLLAFFNFILFLLIGLFGAHAFIATQTSDPEILSYGSTYLTICCCLSFGVFCQITGERLLQSTGRTIYSMITQLTGAIINIILDPILIFGLLGFPRMGIAGAAAATVIGQIVAGAMSLVFNMKRNPDIVLSFHSFLHPKAWVVKRIYMVGVPSILMIAIGSVMTFLMNLILSVFETTATAVFGVYFKLQSFFFMPIFGLNNGLVPILAYNYGAKRKDRIDEALRTALIGAVSFMLIGTLIFWLLPEALLFLFNASDRMLFLGVPALRIISLGFPLAGACIIMSSVFQAFSESIYSLFVSAGRQMLVLIPVAWLLSRTGNVNMVWIAFPVAEGMSLLLSIIFFRKVYRKRVLEW